MALENIKEINLAEKKNFEKFHNIDAENAIIGCLLWDNKNYEKIADIVNEDHFTNENNKTIFKTI